MSEQLALHRRGINDRDPRSVRRGTDYVIEGGRDFDTAQVLADAVQAGLIDAATVETARLEGLDHLANVAINRLRSGDPVRQDVLARGLATNKFTQAEVDAARTFGLTNRARAAIRMLENGVIGPTTRSDIERAVAAGVLCPSQVRAAIARGAEVRRSRQAAP